MIGQLKCLKDAITVAKKQMRLAMLSKTFRTPCKSKITEMAQVLIQILKLLQALGATDSSPSLMGLSKLDLVQRRAFQPAWQQEAPCHWCLNVCALKHCRRGSLRQRRGATVALLSDVSQKAGRVNKVSKPEWQRRRFWMNMAFVDLVSQVSKLSLSSWL